MELYLLGFLCSCFIKRRTPWRNLSPSHYTMDSTKAEYRYRKSSPKIISNNCVAEIKIPRKISHPVSVDFSAALGAYAVLDGNNNILVWNPVTGNILAESVFASDGPVDMAFVSGNEIAVTYVDPDEGGILTVLTLEEGEGCKDLGAFDEVESRSVHLPKPAAGFASSGPHKSIVIFVEHFAAGYVLELELDWESMEIIEERLISHDGFYLDGHRPSVCCSSDFHVFYADLEGVKGGHFRLINRPGDRQIRFCSIQDCVVRLREYNLNKKHHYFNIVDGLACDGKNLIIATNDTIFASDLIHPSHEASLIASNISGPIRLHHLGQLMVCDEKAIKIFRYHNNNPSPLQESCREVIHQHIHVESKNLKSAVCNLEIPFTLKHFLLYQ